MAANPEVDAWFDDYEHPAKDAMLWDREIVLSDDRMTAPGATRVPKARASHTPSSASATSAGWVTMAS